MTPLSTTIFALILGITLGVIAYFPRSKRFHLWWNLSFVLFNLIFGIYYGKLFYFILVLVHVGYFVYYQMEIEKDTEKRKLIES